MELKTTPDVLLFELFKIRLEFINNYSVFCKLFVDDILTLSKSKLDLPTNGVFFNILIKLEDNLNLFNNIGIKVKLMCNYKEEYNIFKMIIVILESGCGDIDNGEFLRCVILTLIQNVDFSCLYIRLKIANEFSCDLRFVQYKDENVTCWVKNFVGGVIGFGKLELKYDHYDNKEYLEKMYKKNVSTIDVFKKTPIYKGPESYIDPPVLEYNKLVTLFYFK